MCFTHFKAYKPGEEYGNNKFEVDELTKKIKEAKWEELTTKNYDILNHIIDEYEEDIIKRKNGKFRRDQIDYQLVRVYTFAKRYNNITPQGPLASGTTPVTTLSELSSEIDSTSETNTLTNKESKWIF